MSCATIVSKSYLFRVRWRENGEEVGPPKGWMDDIKERTGLTAVGATRLTDDRKMWSALLVVTPADVR